jgi:hypothetical protein
LKSENESLKKVMKDLEGVATELSKYNIAADGTDDEKKILKERLVSLIST